RVPTLAASLGKMRLFSLMWRWPVSTEQAVSELHAAMWLGGLIACRACASGMELFSIGSESGARPGQEAAGWIDEAGLRPLACRQWRLLTEPGNLFLVARPIASG